MRWITAAIEKNVGFQGFINQSYGLIFRAVRRNTTCDLVASRDTYIAIARPSVSDMPVVVFGYIRCF